MKKVLLLVKQYEFTNVPKEYLAVTSRLSRGYLAVQYLCLQLINCEVQQRQVIAQ